MWSRRAMIPFIQHNKAQLSLVYIYRNNLEMLLKFLERILDTTDKKHCTRSIKKGSNECIKYRSELRSLQSLCSGC